jgi:hypothetical protein
MTVLFAFFVKKNGNICLLIKPFNIVTEKMYNYRGLETRFYMVSKKPRPRHTHVLLVSLPGNSQLKDRACCSVVCDRAHADESSRRRVEIEASERAATARSPGGCRTRRLMIRAPSPVPWLDRPERPRS